MPKNENIFSFTTLKPSGERHSSGATVHPRRTPVKPTILEKDEISIAHCNDSSGATVHPRRTPVN
ncbi:hypothetical protein Hanom_Chr06g00516021 [Helianthus anomalus]